MTQKDKLDFVDKAKLFQYLSTKDCVNVKTLYVPEKDESNLKYGERMCLSVLRQKMDMYC